jgi:hypothetical protein
MTPSDQLETAHEALAKAREHLRVTEVAAMTAKRARKKIAATATADEVKKTILADECAAEMFDAAKRGLDDAKADIVIAEKRIESSERNERRRLQHERGVLPIRSLQAQANALETQLAQVRAQQQSLFANEVAPRNPEWQPTTMFSQPPADCYLSVGHVIERGLPQPKEPEPLPPSTLQPRSGAPLSQEEKYYLLFCLDRRGDAFAGDAMLRYGVPLKDLYATADDERFGGEAVRDPELLATLRSGLTRATNISRAVRGDEPTPEWCQQRMGQLKGWVRPTYPVGADGKPAIAPDGSFAPGA